MNNKDDDDRWMREAATRRQKNNNNNNMGKSAFKRSKSILETINIVYLSQQLLHSRFLTLCVCVRAFVLPLYLERISHQLFLTFFHKTH